MSGEPQFLTREHIEILHKYEIRRYGGIPGLRAEDRLLAAVQAPCSTWAGRYLYSYPFEMAAVYLESLARGHAFLDGNKRTALAAALRRTEGRAVRQSSASICGRSTQRLQGDWTAAIATAYASSHHG